MSSTPQPLFSITLDTASLGMDANDEVCRAPDGTPMVTLGLGKNAPWILLLIASIPLATFVLAPRIFLLLGRWFGAGLQKQTAWRRAQILKQTEADEMAYLVPEGTRRNSDDWEDIDAFALGTAKNGGAADPEWDGIVGFFHPFWYARIYSPAILLF